MLQKNLSYTDIFKALGDESRLRIVNLLRNASLNVQELTKILGLSQSTVSHHLKTLTAAQITELHKEGTWVYYRLQSDTSNAVNQIIDCFLNLQEDTPDPLLAESLHGDNQKRIQILDERRNTGKRFFEKVAKDWNKIRTEQGDDSDFLMEIAERVPHDQRVLELGCGSGLLLKMLASHARQAIGVDFSQAMLDQARLALEVENVACELRLGYLEHLPLADSSIDYALSYMVLHHIPEVTQALKDAYRVLAPTGQLLVLDYCPHKDESMRDKYGDLWLGFNPEQMQSWAEAVGFKKFSCEFFGLSKEVFLLTCIK